MLNTLEREVCAQALAGRLAEGPTQPDLTGSVMYNNVDVKSIFVKRIASFIQVGTHTILDASLEQSLTGVARSKQTSTSPR
jgi:hypothetical protein